MKKVLAIMGSPRKGKNTDQLLDKVLEGIKDSGEEVEIKKVYLKDLKIAHCIGCGYCEKTGKCFMNDDMNVLYDEFDSADSVIIASPVYFNSVNSFTKAMIDRCQAYWSSKYVLNKPSIDRNKKRLGVFLGVGGAPETEDQFLGAKLVIDYFFRAVNNRYEKDILVPHTDEEAVWEREDIMKEAYETGKHLFDNF